MASEVLLVNPRKRRRRRPVRRASPRRKTAARRPAKRRRRRNPIGPYARSGMGMYVSNPRRRRKKAGRKRVSRARRRTRYRRNPTMRSLINSLVMPAASAAGGAILLDALWGYIPIPETIKSGQMRHVAKGVGAIALGMIVGKVANRRMGDTMALGALTVTFHAAFRDLMAQFAPGVALSGLSYYSAGANAGYDPQLGYYVESPRLTTQGGESHPAPNSELGYYVQEGVGSNY